MENSGEYWINRYLPTKNQGKIGIYLQRTKVAHLANVTVLRDKYGMIFGKSCITGKITYYVMSDKYGRKPKFSKLNPIGWPTYQIKLGGKGGGGPNK